MTVTNNDNYCAWSADLPRADQNRLEPIKTPPRSREKKSRKFFSMWFLTITAVKVWNTSQKEAQIPDDFFFKAKIRNRIEIRVGVDF